MGVIEKYETQLGLFWKVDAWITGRDGSGYRLRKRRIPTKTHAMELLKKAERDAFEGIYLDRRRTRMLTVAEAWDQYSPVSRRDKKSWKTDKGRSTHLLRHLGNRKASGLTLLDVDEYRTRRLTEKTKRGGPPAFSTLNREIALLRRMLNYAVDCGELPSNPLVRVTMLKEDNVRQVMIEEDKFAVLHECAEEPLRPILLTAYDTGLRIGNLLNLKQSQLRLKGKRAKIVLAPQDVKANSTPTVVLTDRVRDALRKLPRSISGYVFVNPKTGRPWRDIRKMFHRACKKAEIDGLWFHDQRRAFITNARRRGVDESTIMSMSGHRTRSAFERYNIVSEKDQEEAVRKIEAGRDEALAESAREATGS